MPAMYFFFSFLLYLFCSGMYFLILSEGDFQTDLGRRIFNAAVMGLSVPAAQVFWYWYRKRKKAEDAAGKR